MTEFTAYLRVQVKRIWRLYPAVLAFTVALVAVLAVLVTGLFGNRAAQEEKQKIRVGLVGDITDTYLGIGVAAVKNFDSSQFYLEFVEMDEQSAKQQVSSGALMGYVRIPDDFVQSLVRGENKKVQYVAGNSPSALGPLMMEEIAMMVSDLIVEAQSGIYGFMDTVDDTDLSRNERNALVDELNLRYIQQILGREAAYTVSFIGISSGLPFVEYYFCAFFLLLLLLCGTVCAHLLVKTDLSLPRLLYISGHRAEEQILAEYLPFAGMLCVNVLLLFGGIGAVLSGMGLSLLPDVVGVVDWLLLGLQLLPAVLLIAAMQFLVYELTNSLISGVLAQVLTTIVLAYASGLLYPLDSLPVALQALAAYLPTGVAFRYVSGVITWDGGGLLALLLYTVVLLLCTVLVRRMRLRGAVGE